MSKKKEVSLPSLEAVQVVPLELLDEDPNQPRRFFDAEALSVQAFDVLTVFNERTLNIYGNCTELPD